MYTCIRFVLLSLPLAATVVRAQQYGPRTEIIRGRVTADSGGLAINNATVLLTPFGTRDSRATKSDATGQFKVVFSPGRGDYLIHVTAPGHKAFDRRVTRAPGAVDSVLVVDVTLSRLVQQLAAMRVVASRRRKPPVADAGDNPGVGSVDVGLSNMVFDPTSRGDLAAMAASAPGISVSPSTDGAPPGYSVLGLSSTQNAVTLNGLSFGGPSIPSAALANIRLQQTGSDPSIGGFSGALVTVSLQQAGNFSLGTATLNLEDPTLQLTDQAGRSLGQRYRNVQVSLARLGPLVRDRLTYNVSVQAGRRTSDATSLATANAGALQRVGVSAASADRLLQALEVLQIPTQPAGTPGQLTTSNASFLGRLDLLPSPQRTISFTGSFGWHRSTPTQLTALAAPSRSVVVTNLNGALMGEFARYVSDYYLTRTRTGASVQQMHGDPLAFLPEGSVLALSALPDGASGLATLQFGGASGFPLRTRRTTLEFTHETSWFLPSNKHRPKIAGGARADAYANDATPNGLGSFAFNSIDDLVAGRPVSFRRTLRGGPYDARAEYLWASASDLWRPTGRFALQYGVRLEANGFGTKPAYNAPLDDALGVRTDVAPRPQALLPRLGLTWQYGRARTLTGGPPPPAASMRATLGAYRAPLPVTLLGPVLTGTGLPDALQRISCMGPAAPAPDWAAYVTDPSTIPTKCADDARSAAFADALPSATLFLPGYDAPVSWRASVGGSHFALRGLRASLDASYSLNLHQASMLDVNFGGVPAFALADEGGRAVYANTSRIDPSTGAIDPLASRRDARFSRVSGLASDLRSESRQVTLSVRPVSQRSILSSSFWYLSYTLAHVRDQSRGWDGATFGDPRTVSWGRSAADVRHAVNLSIAWSLGTSTSINLFGRMRSGTPFTPLVRGDVNGDGLANDRAFVVDPARARAAGENTVATEMQRLLDTGPSGVRKCLASQLGRAALRNSCRGPWTASLYLNINIAARDLGLPNRSRILLTIANPLAGLDQLLHGSEGLHGWGQPTAPDPTLYAVTGFDAASQRFRYAVNPSFGDTRPGRSTLRAPFALRLQVSTPIGATFGRQQLDDALGPGRFRKGERLTVDEIKRRYANIIFNPVPMILDARDSLLLTKEQETRLRAMHARYRAVADTVLIALAKDFGALPERYDVADAMRRVRAARERLFAAVEVLSRDLRETLTPDQREQLPSQAQQLLDERLLKRLRAANPDY